MERLAISLVSEKYFYWSVKGFVFDMLKDDIILDKAAICFWGIYSTPKYED